MAGAPLKNQYQFYAVILSCFQTYLRLIKYAMGLDITVHWLA